MSIIDKKNLYDLVEISDDNESWCACNSGRIRPPHIKNDRSNIKENKNK